MFAIFIVVTNPAPAQQQTRIPVPAIYEGVKKVQTWIPMKDGTRLAVNLFMPDGAKPGDTFPAILSYLPYRKDDWSLAGDWQQMSFFVRRGYVGARVDIRGTGASEGDPPDREYSEQEQEDGLEVIDWLSQQPWSSGTVGMFGISWVASTPSNSRAAIRPRSKPSSRSARPKSFSTTTSTTSTI